MAWIMSVWIWLTMSLVSGVIDDFRVGIQLCDGNAGQNVGSVLYTPWLLNAGGWSGWAGNNNYYDPDGLRIGLFGRDNSASQATEFKIEDTDIRFCIQLTDNANSAAGNSKYNGVEKCTDWASAGGGWSSFACDSNCFDFDAVRVKLDTQAQPGLVITDIQAAIQLTDGGTSTSKMGTEQYTNWLIGTQTQSSTWSAWAGDSNFYDPDAIKIFLGVHMRLAGNAGVRTQDEIENVATLKTRNGSAMQLDKIWIVVASVVFSVVIICVIVMVCSFGKRSNDHIPINGNDDEYDVSNVEVDGIKETEITV